jgi:hypothetical protein
MKSPFTNTEAILCFEDKEVEYRQKKFIITAFFYKCPDTGKEFQTGELIEVCIGQVYKQYREKYGPFSARG